MNTKEAIEITKSFKSGLNIKHFKDEVNYFDSIIELLQRGEKYKNMWGEIKEELKVRKNFKIPEKYLAVQGGTVIYLMEILEQKYFPKPVKKIIMIEIEGNPNSVDLAIDGIGSSLNNRNDLKIDIVIKKDGVVGPIITKIKDGD